VRHPPTRRGSRSNEIEDVTLNLYVSIFYFFLRPPDVGCNYALTPSTGGCVVVTYGHIDSNIEVCKPNSHVHGLVTPAVNATVSNRASYLHNN
jgi:hypothetical protein